MNKERKSLSISTVIYLTATFVLLSYQFFINGSLSYQSVAGVLILTSIPYISLTRKFYYLLPFVSIFLLLLVIGSIPVAVYQVTGSEPGLTIAAPILGFLSTLLMGTFISHSEWSIKNPWIANILGTCSLFVVETLILTSTLSKSQLLISSSGLLAYILTSYSYLMIGRWVKVNKPSTMKGDAVSIRLLDFLAQNGYLYVNNPKQPQRRDTLFDEVSKNGDSFRFIFAEDAIIVDKAKKKFDRFQFYKDGGAKRAYSWLMREAIKSKEAKKTDKVKNEHFIYVQVDKDLKEPSYSVIELPLARSSNVLNVGVLNTNGDLNSKTLDVMNNLAIDLEVLNN